MRTKSLSQAQASLPGTLHVIETVIPGVRMTRTWHWRWLWVHLVTGVTIFAMLELQGDAYGERAGVAPVVGLYPAICSMVGYALCESSQRMMIGPEASSAILVTTTLLLVASKKE